MQKAVRVIECHDKHNGAKNCLLLMTFTRDSQRILYIKIATVLVAFLSLLECTLLSLGCKRHGAKSLRCSYSEFFLCTCEYIKCIPPALHSFFLVHSSEYLLLSK